MHYQVVESGLWNSVWCAVGLALNTEPEEALVLRSVIIYRLRKGQREWGGGGHKNLKFSDPHPTRSTSFEVKDQSLFIAWGGGAQRALGEHLNS